MSHRTRPSSRRRFLASSGMAAGATLLSPLLSSIHAEMPTSEVRRFVFVVECNGIEPHNFLSDAARTALLATGADIQPGDRTLERKYVHDSPVVVDNAGLASAPALGALSGLEDQAAVLLGQSSKVVGGGHSGGLSALSLAPSKGVLPSAATIDHVLAQIPGIGDATPFDVVRFGINGRNKPRSYSTCATGARKPAPIICQPTAAFNAMFGSVASAAGQRSFNNRRELLDFASADVTAALASFGGSSRERQKLERYIESLEVLTNQHGRIVEMGPALTLAAPESPETSPLYASPHPLEHLQAMFHVATSALIGCLTNVVVLASGTGDFSVSYTSISPETGGRHDECHANNVAHLTAVTRRHVDMVAEMAATLRSVPEGDGTMLDHTAIVYMSDNGEKHHSNAVDWPMLLLGGSAMGLNTGNRTVVYPGYGNANNRQVSNTFNTLGHMAGVEMNEFGSEGATRIAAGPLSEIFG